MISRKTISISRVLFIVYLLAVCYLCLFRIPSPAKLPSEIFGIPSDKLVHFLMFLPFIFLLYFSIGKVVANPIKSIFYILIIFSIGCIIAASTELAQGMTAYRTPDRMDFLADALSLAFGSVIICIINIRLSKES